MWVETVELEFITRIILNSETKLSENPCERVWLPKWLSGKELTSQCRWCGFDLWARKIPWRRKWQPTPVFSPGKSHGQRSLVGYSLWGHKVSDTTEQLNNNNKKGGKILSNTQQFAKDMKYLITIFVSFTDKDLKGVWKL